MIATKEKKPEGFTGWRWWGWKWTNTFSDLQGIVIVARINRKDGSNGRMKCSCNLIYWLGSNNCKKVGREDEEM